MKMCMDCQTGLHDGLFRMTIDVECDCNCHKGKHKLKLQTKNRK